MFGNLGQLFDHIFVWGTSFHMKQKKTLGVGVEMGVYM